MANATTVYAAAAAVTIGLASLATSANGDAGREATAISNSTNKYLDALLSGKITVGTPTVDTTIQIWVFAARNETPTWPDVMAGADAAKTWSSVGVRNGAAVLLHTLQVDSTTSNRAYEFSGLSVARAFGGVLPDDWSVFVTQDTGAILNATAGNHVMEYIGVTYA